MKRSREPEDLDSDQQSGDAGSPDTLSTPEPFAKVVQLDVTEVTATSVSTMKCSMPPHKEPVSFQSYEEWETHYNQVHMNRCYECRKNFPSAHLLELHIEECHDSFIAVKRDRGEHTFSCFVEGCERKCRTPQKRRMHLIDKHMYPKNFFFAVTKDGIDGRRSLLVDSSHHRRRSSTGASTTKENRRRASILESGGPSSPKSSGTVKPTPKAADDEESSEDSEKEEPDTEMAELTGAMSALQFVPSSVRFGRGGKRGGLAKR